MFSYIDRLRKKPKKQKKLFALLFSGGVTFFIFIFWFSGNYLEKNSYFEKENSKITEASPFEVLVRYSDRLVSSTVEVFLDARYFFEEINLEELTGLISKKEERQTVLEETNESPEETERVIYKIKDRESFNDEEKSEENELIDVSNDESTSDLDSEEERQTVLEETNDSPEETERVIYKIKDRESFNDEEQEQVNSDDEN